MAHKRFNYRFVGPAKDFALKPGLNAIGRYLYCQVHLDAEDIAGEHATVEVEESGDVSIAPVQDSVVYVNGRQAKGRMPLRAGDTVQVGEMYLTLLTREPTVSIPAERKPTRLRSFGRRVFLVLVLLISTVGALYGLAKILVSPAWLSEKTADYLSKVLQRDVQIEGMKVDLIRSKATYETIEIKDTAEFHMAPVATLHGVKVEVDGLIGYAIPFIGRPKYTVEAVEASVVIRKDATGRYNIDDLVEHITESMNVGRLDLPFVSAVVSRGTARYEEQEKEPVQAKIEKLDFTFAEDLLSVACDLKGDNGLVISARVNRTAGGTAGVKLAVERLPRSLFRPALVVPELRWGMIDAICSLRLSPSNVLGHFSVTGAVHDASVGKGDVGWNLGKIGFSGTADVDREHGVVKGTAALSGESVDVQASVEADLKNHFVAGGMRGKIAASGRGGYSIAVNDEFGLRGDVFELQGRASLAGKDGKDLLDIRHDLAFESGRVVVRAFEALGVVSVKTGQEPVEIPPPADRPLNIRFSGLDMKTLSSLSGYCPYFLPANAIPVEEGTITIQQTPDACVKLKIASAVSKWSVEFLYSHVSHEANISMYDGEDKLTAKGKLADGVLEVVAEGTGEIRRLIGMASLAFPASECPVVTGSGKVTLTLGKFSIRPDGMSIAAGGRLKAEKLSLGNLWPDPLTDDAPFVFNATIPRSEDELVTVSSLRWEGSSLKVDGSGKFDRKNEKVTELRGSMTCDIEKTPAVSSWIANVLHVPLRTGHLAAEIAPVQPGSTECIANGALEIGQSSIKVNAEFVDVQALLKGSPRKWGVEGSVPVQELTGGVIGAKNIDGVMKVVIKGTYSDDTGNIAGEIDFTDAMIIAGPFRKELGLAAKVHVGIETGTAKSLAFHIMPVLGTEQTGKLNGDAIVVVLPTSVGLAAGGKFAGDSQLIERLFPGVTERVRFEKGTWVLEWDKPWMVAPADSFWGLVARLTGTLKFENCAVSAALAGYGWQGFTGNGVFQFSGRKVEGEIGSLELPGLKKGNCTLTVSLSEETNGVFLDKLAIRADEVANPGQVLGAVRAWREAGEMKEEATVTSSGTFVPYAQTSIMRSGKGDEWAVIGSGAIGGFGGKAIVSADGSVHITGKWTVTDIAVVEKQIPGWPFRSEESIEMDEVIDGTGARSVRYTPAPPANPEVLLRLLVPGEAGDWKPAGDAPYVKYADKRPVKLDARLVRKDKGEILLSGGQEEGGMFRLRVTHADGRGKDIRFIWDNGWKKKDEAEVAPSNERRRD